MLWMYMTAAVKVQRAMMSAHTYAYVEDKTRIFARLKTALVVVIWQPGRLL